MELDEIQYDWPQNVLSYETRLLFGLSVNELLAVAMSGVIFLFIHVALGLAALALGFLMALRFEGLGDRRLPDYLLARLKHRFGRREVTLARILPAEQGEEIVITDLNGAELARIGGAGWPSSS